MDKGSSKNPKPKTSPLGRNTALPVVENDAAWLVGGIVEKGFSETTLSAPSSSPRPSVLPFPMARHRSHGPHWAPKAGSLGAIADDVMEEDGEEDDFRAMTMAAGIANRVPRKEKKGLDFSQWQEIMKKGGLSEKEKEMRPAAVRAGNKAKEQSFGNSNRLISNSQGAIGDYMKEQSMTIHDSGSAVNKGITEETIGFSQNGIAKSKGSNAADIGTAVRNKLTEEMNMDSEMQSSTKAQVASSFGAHKLAGEGDNLKSQIDAENRARLSEMSSNEIAEAQAEIMGKLNPELINALKKRGHAKLTRQKFSVSDESEADNAQREENLSELTASSKSTRYHKPVRKAAEDAQSEKDNKASSNTGDQNRSMWDAWRERVERVRDLRFSLDGSIINSDFAQVSDSGNASLQSGYSADNVSERDFLRTEGDPGAVGYTITEAVALTRSVVPGQRAFALHLIASLLDKAIHGICCDQVDSVPKFADGEGSVDWEAVWAFALGPEPELVLSLRMSLDDNHNSVVLAGAKAIHSVLSCDINEATFDISEKTPTYLKDVCTAPIFRSKQDINEGFLRGGYWKYNTKPTNIYPLFDEVSLGDESEGQRTIRDDVVIAGQDIAAGLVRMGIVPRICYLLETDPAASLEECLISILIAIARHSPTSAAEIVNCERLVPTVANIFASKEHMEINPCKIKLVTLFKVLARYDKKSCLTFIQNGLFHKVTWHLHRPISLDQWIKSGREACRLSSALLVEQLRFWKVCLQYGYCLSDFSNLFASLCLWLSVPTMDKLIDNDVMSEYCAITKEAYLLLNILAGRLPNFYTQVHRRAGDTVQDKETTSWNQFGPIIDLAMEWIEVKSIPRASRFFYCTGDSGNSSLSKSELKSFLWVLSSVLNLLSSVLKAVMPEDMTNLPNQSLERLPDFVSKIGLKIIKNGYLKFSGLSDTNYDDHSVVDDLCCLMLENRQELALSSTCCLQGLVHVIVLVDKLIQNTKLDIHKVPSKFISLSTEDIILAKGILESSPVELRGLLTTLMRLMTEEWQWVQRIEIFGRGGPSPGVGAGWGASGGGYWSLKTLLAQQCARLLTDLLEVSEIPSVEGSLETEIGLILQRINCALAACLVVSPGNRSVINQLLNFMFQVPTLKYLDVGMRQFLRLRNRFKPFEWNYEDEEYLSIASVLVSHFKNRWLDVKKKKKANKNNNSNDQTPKKGSRSLETIHEDPNVPIGAGEELASLLQGWAHQRLHLPAHWFLSAISTIHCEKNTEVPLDILEVGKGGLFFLLGIEAIPAFITSDPCTPVRCVPVVWKLHALSVLLLSGMGVLEDKKSRDVYETLQNVYGEFLDENRLSSSSDSLTVEALQFKTEIHENYSTFIETLVDQFAAESYGDVLFGRQVAVYIHRSVEASIRLATWNALSNARVLELLPPLDKCLMNAEGYLEPIEDDERILEAYGKSWVSGALDKATTRGSASSTMVLHHLSSFIFSNVAGDKLSLRNKLVKSLLRDYSRKQQHDVRHSLDMMVKLICYTKPDSTLQPASETAPQLPMHEIDQRLQILKVTCEGNSSLLMVVEKLDSRIKRNTVDPMS